MLTEAVNRKRKLPSLHISLADYILSGARVFQQLRSGILQHTMNSQRESPLAFLIKIGFWCNDLSVQRCGSWARRLRQRVLWLLLSPCCFLFALLKDVEKSSVLSEVVWWLNQEQEGPPSSSMLGVARLVDLPFKKLPHHKMSSGPIVVPDLRLPRYFFSMLLSFCLFEMHCLRGWGC